MLLTDDFQSELNSDFLIGRKFSQLPFLRPIREPHTLKSDRDHLYPVILITISLLFRNARVVQILLIALSIVNGKYHIYSRHFYRFPCLARTTDACDENLLAAIGRAAWAM